MTDSSGMADTGDRQTRILDDLQNAVQRMHVLARSPRIIVAWGYDNPEADWSRLASI